MARYIEFLKKHGKITVFLFGLACIMCAVSFRWTQEEYGQEMFLPQEADSLLARQTLLEEYGRGLPDLQVMVQDISVPAALSLKREMEELEEVACVVWLDDVWNLQMPLEMAEPGVVENWYRDGKACFSVTTAAGREAEAVRRIRMLTGEEVCISGAAAERLEAENSFGKLRERLLFLTPVILALLVLATGSWAEPVWALCTLTAACLLSRGLAVFFGVTSGLIRFSAVLLATGVSGCAALVFLRICDENRSRGMGAGDAVGAAFGRLSGVFFSCLLTLSAGIITLLSMEYGAGPQMGRALAAVCVACLICLLCLLPALAFLTAGLTGRLEHRSLLPSGVRLSRVAMKLRIPLLLLAAFILSVCFLAADHTAFYYGDTEAYCSEASRAGREAAAIQKLFGSAEPVTLLIPRGSPETEAALYAELREPDWVAEVICAAGTEESALPEEYGDKRTLSGFYSAHYSRYEIWLEADEREPDWSERVNAIENMAEKYAGADFQCAGRPVERAELKCVAERERSSLHFLTLLLRFVVLACCLRSLLCSALLLLLAEAVLQPVLGMPFLMGERAFYAGYLAAKFLSGALVMVWLLMYAACTGGKQEGTPEEVTGEAAGICTLPILLSAAAMAVLCLPAVYDSGDGILSLMGILTGFGVLITAVLLLLLWPGLLKISARTEERKKNRARRRGIRPGETGENCGSERREIQ